MHEMKSKINVTLKSFEKIPSISTEFLRVGAKPKESKTEQKHQESRVASYAFQKKSASTFRNEIARRSISSIALPKKQTIFTVLRSPHIDKKARDQFEQKIYKQLIIFETEIYQIREKLDNLKFHEIPGVQMKIVFETKTRLCLKNQDKNKRSCGFREARNFCGKNSE